MNKIEFIIVLAIVAVTLGFKTLMWLVGAFVSGILKIIHVISEKPTKVPS